MKKLLLTLVATTLAVVAMPLPKQEAYMCKVLSIKDLNSDNTQYISNLVTAIFAVRSTQLEAFIDDQSYSFTYKQTIDTTKVYVNEKRQELLGVFNNFEGGVRTINSDTSIDFVNCKKLPN